MSLQKEAELSFCGWVGAFALLDLHLEEQPGHRYGAGSWAWGTGQERGDVGRDG